MLAAQTARGLWRAVGDWQPIAPHGSFRLLPAEIFARTAKTTPEGRNRARASSVATGAISLISELEYVRQIAIGHHEERFHVGG